MSFSTLAGIGQRRTPQTEPIAGTSRNNAGGQSFTLDRWHRLDRFLVLGVDGGTYYVGARDLALDNAKVVAECLDEDPLRTVRAIVDISVSGRAPKNDPALFALAMACAHPHASPHAFIALPEVCRTGTHLFHFAEFVKGQRGWGRGLRRAIAEWYNGKDADQLAYQLVKYRQRDGWTHGRLLNLAHPKPANEARNALHRFAKGLDFNRDDAPDIIRGFAAMQDAKRPEQAAWCIDTYRLPWESVPSDLLRSVDVWHALLDAQALPLGATIRQLGVMTARGIAPRFVDSICTRLVDAELLRRARIHPLGLLNALLTYKSGISRGGVEWVPDSRIVDALDRAFYLSFGAVEPTGRRLMLALDVSGSMTAPVAGAQFTAMQGSTAMAMVTAAVEPGAIFRAFSGGGGWAAGPSEMVPVDVSPRRRLDDQMRELHDVPFGRTDCSLPMLHALETGLAVDAFVVYTDSETYAGRMHPVQALRDYRQRTGIAAKLVVVGMTSTGFTIADPNDPGSLDVVGFDTATPSVLSSFIADKL